MITYTGEIAALITSLCFSATSIQFTLAGRRVSSIVVNRTRLALAMILISLAHWLFLGRLVPLDASPERWLWLGLSGVVGLVLGDVFLFQAFVWIGPRLSMLMMSLAPVIAALLAWLFLDEALNAGQMLGILVTLGGITWVILARDGKQHESDRDPDYLRGVLFALGGATGQAVGLILAKKGLGGDFSPISANVIRMLTAGISLWTITLIQGQARETIRRLRGNRRAVLLLLGGTFTGPLLGVSFSLLAVQRAQVGIASTLMALPPIFLLPIGYFAFKERFGWEAIAGTVVAILGVGLLFMV